MALTAVGIAVGIGSAASAGYQAKRGHDQEVQARHATDDEKAKQQALEDQLAAKQKANQQLADNEIELQRQRALAATGNYRNGTIRTSPSGVPGAPRVGGNTYLGAA